ncbi:hypothetical protein F4803DRAFT_557504 [Xylaria telfairii]|nr:hypothetical protein F4803DRAFT_557504 [Xylaria telfairii]
MNTTLASDTLPWLSQALAPFCALQDLALRFLLYFAKTLQHAETWSLSAFGAPTHTIYRMFPPEDISDYTRNDAQLGALFLLAALIFSHSYGYLGPHPAYNVDHDPWLVRVLFRGCRIGKYIFTYLRIPFIIAYIHAAHNQFETDRNFYLLFLASAMPIIHMAI